MYCACSFSVTRAPFDYVLHKHEYTPLINLIEVYKKIKITCTTTMAVSPKPICITVVFDKHELQRKRFMMAARFC